MSRALSILSFAVVGCTLDQNPVDPPQLLPVDWSDFACKVDRVVARRCSMLACHGQSTPQPDGTIVYHAFRVYSPGKLRLAPWRTLADRSAPSTLAEVKANFASAQGMTYGARSVDDVPLVHKTIAPAAGGGEHMGGVIFRDDNDPDLAALRAWLGGEKMPDGCDLLKSLQ